MSDRQLLTAKKTLLEISPSACLLILGPGATGSKTCSDLLEAALRYLQTTRQIPFSSKRKLIAEIKKAEKHEQVGAGLRRAIHALKEIDCFSEWLRVVYDQASSTPFETLLLQLQELHKQGVLLACTQLDSLPGTIQTTVHDEEKFKNWLSCGEGEEELLNVDTDDAVPILHLCGLYTNTQTLLVKNSEAEIESLPSASNGDVKIKLKELLQERLVIFVGFEDDTQNPFLQDFLEEYYVFFTQRVLKHPPIMITSRKESLLRHRGASSSTKEDGIFTQFLTLEVEKEGESFLRSVISLGLKQNFSVARVLSDRQTDGTKFQAFLLFNEKQSFRKLGEIIYHQSRSGEIYVRRDALTVVYSSGKILYSNIITYGGNGLRQLWRLVFADCSTLLGKGLVAFGLQNSAIVWIRGRPDGLGDVVDVSTTYAGKSSLSATTIVKSMTQPTLPTGQAKLATSSSATPTPWPVSTSLIQSHVRSFESPNQPTALPSPYRDDGMLPIMHNIPPPPKLIKIPTTSSEDSVTTSPGPEPQEYAKLAAATRKEQEGSSGHEAWTSSHALPSLPSDSGEYLQAIMDLQERINRQLSSGESGVSDGVHVVSPSVPNNQTPILPPQYCVAGPSELLLDVISQSQFVKLHECTIQRTENSTNPDKQLASLNHTKTTLPLSTSAGTPKLVQRTTPDSNILLNGNLSQEANLSHKRSFQSSSEQRTVVLSSPVIPPNVFSPSASPRDILSPAASREDQNSSPKTTVVPAVPNYCVALNPFPIMFVNPAIPMVQQMPTAMNIPMGVATTAGLPSNQLMCYVTPSGLINPLISHDTNGSGDTNICRVEQNSPRQPNTQAQSKTAMSSLLHDYVAKHKNGMPTSADTRHCSAGSVPPPSKRLCLADREPADSLGRGGDSDTSGTKRQAADSRGAIASEEESEGNVDSSSSLSTSPHSTLTSDGSVQLWIFLLDLLLSPNYRHIIHWTGNTYEFRIAQPASLARLWGSHRNKPQMTYEKMSRALRYYYSRGIIESVRGRKQTFRFSLDLEKYVSSNKDKETLEYLKSCCHL